MSVVQITTLDNGVIVASERMPGALSVSAGVWLDLGSRDESPLTQGLCHFYEHMVFKGTQTRSPLQIAREIEDRGGHLNAFTSKDHTCFYTRTVSSDLPLALNLLADLLMNPKLEESEAKNERRVVIEEIRGYEDTPDDVVHDFFAKAHFANQGVAHPVTGTASTVKLFGRKQLLRQQRRVLESTPIFIVVAGNVRHQWLVEECSRLFSAKKAVTKPNRRIVKGFSGEIIVRRTVQQANMVLGATLADGDFKHRIALGLLNIILGDGMSSRLFQEVREKRGLAYSVNSAIDAWKGSRTLSIYLGTDPARAQKSLDAITAEITEICKNGLRTGELERAKCNLLGNLQVGLDSPSNRMNRLARQLLRRGSWTSPQEVLRKVQMVQKCHVESVIQTIFLESPWAFAAVLPRNGCKQLRWKDWHK